MIYNSFIINMEPDTINGLSSQDITAIFKRCEEVLENRKYENIRYSLRTINNPIIKDTW